MENTTTNNENSSMSCCKGRGMSKCASGCAYGLGVIGAAVYFIGKAATFGAGALGLLKAIVWPAIVVYEVMKFLNL